MGRCNVAKHAFCNAIDAARRSMKISDIDRLHSAIQDASGFPEPKDREWIRPGIAAGILSLPTIEYRMRDTLFIDADEHTKAKSSLNDDSQWFNALRKRK